MKSSKKKLTLLLSMFALFFMAAGNYQEKSSAVVVDDFAGNWDITFYNAAGKLQGSKTIIIAEDGSFSRNAILSIDNVIYQTKVEGNVNTNGVIKDGKLMDVDKIEVEGTFTGTFTETSGSGTWKNYHGNSGTWKAERSTKKDKRE